MEELKQKRQLAAIMFTDIVGYTALMGEDEDKAFALLKKNRQLQKPLIEGFNGKWLKEIGDGILASFNSVTDAVYCAAAIQEASQIEEDLKLKIGIHLREVVFEGEDVFGDGVNIASRLESLAPAGGIWVSESVSRNIQNKQGFETSFLREEVLKNVKDPVKIYEIKVTGELPDVDNQAIKNKDNVTLSPRRLQKLIIPFLLVIALVVAYIFLKPTIFNEKVDKDISEVGLAIMPLKNISGNEDIDFLSFALKDEIHEVLALSKKFAFLSSQSATATYIDKNVSPQSIGQELGVDYALTGTYQISGDQLNVRVDFADTHTGNSVWTKKFIVHYEAANIFPMQSDIAQKVLALFNEERDGENLPSKTIDLEAYRHYVKGMELWNKDDNEGPKAIEELELAIELDSAQTKFWIDITVMKSNAIFLKDDKSEEYLAEVESYIEELSKNHPHWAAELARGIYQYHALRNYDGGIVLLKAVLADYPDNEIANSYLGYIYKRKLKLNLAYRYLLKSINLNPMNSIYWSNLSAVFRINGDYKNALLSRYRALEVGKGARYQILYAAHQRAAVSFDSIPQKYRDTTYVQIALDKVWFDKDPRKIINEAKKIPFAVNPGSTYVPSRSNYTRTRYYRDLAIAYHALYLDDSARYFAELTIATNEKQDKKEWYWVAQAYSILGNVKKSESLRKLYYPVNSKDQYQLAIRKRSKLIEMVLARKYTEATDLLVELNNTFPEFGDYQFLTHSIYNRARKEYPPFGEAMVNLKLPLPLVEDKDIERLKY